MKMQQINTYLQCCTKFFIMCCVSLMLSGCGRANQLLMDNLSTREMSELTISLFQEGVLTTVTRANDGTYAVSVEKRDYLTARKVLLNLGVFRDNTKDDLLKIITKSSMVENPVEQRFYHRN